MRSMRYFCALLFIVGGTQFQCSRDFKAPKPSPKISSIDPLSGFMGSTVVISGRNFSTSTGGNLVIFGHENARVVSEGAESIEVEVPMLQMDEEIFISVSTDKGMSTFPSPFLYKGPGHPLQGELHDSVIAFSGPLEVTPGCYNCYNGLHPTPVFSTNIWSHSIGFFNIEDQIHYEIGVVGTPFSIARGRDSKLRPMAFVTTLRSGSVTDSPTLLQSFTVGQQGDVLGFLSPEEIDLPDIDGDPFVPGYITSYCSNSDCTIMRLAVFDLYRPALALFDFADPDNKIIVNLNSPGPSCEKPQEPRPFLDLVHFSSDGASGLLALISGQPNIWRISDMGSDDSCPAHLWPVEGSPDGSSEMEFSALALCRSGTRLYAADTTVPLLVEFTLDSSGNSLTESGAIYLLGTPFSVKCGIPPDDINGEPSGERLYVATDKGIQLIGTGEQPGDLQSLGFLELGSLQGVPQSLVRMPNQHKEPPSEKIFNDGDRMVFADLLHDRLLVIPAGDESLGISAIPVSAPVPFIAPSRYKDLFYIADPYSNVLNLVDENTGVYTSQFLIDDINSFGAANVLTASLGTSAEALLVPLPDPEGLSACDGFDRLAVRLATGEESFDDWFDEWIEGGYGHLSMNMAEVNTQGCFDEILLAPDFNSVLLVRYGQGGRVWSIGLSPDAEIPGGLITLDSGLELSIPFSGKERLVRMAPSAQVLAILGQNSSAQPQVEFTWLNQQDSSDPILLDSYISMFLSDMAIKLSPSRQAVVYLSLPSLGEVAVLENGLEPYLILTSGSPAKLSFSPDGNRLYATQPKEHRISIIDTGCEPLAGCERVLDQIDLGDYPDKVIFHSSGEKAYVTHQSSKMISIIK